MNLSEFQQWTEWKEEIVKIVIVQLQDKKYEKV